MASRSLERSALTAPPAPSLGDLDGLRVLFPVTRERVFFNHAGISPIPLPVADAMRHCIDRLTILGAVFTCGLWCFAMHRTDRKFLPKPLQMGRALAVLNLVASAALTAFGVKAILDFFGG